MIKIRIFGRLRKKAGDPEVRETGLLKMTPEPEETMQSILERAGISPQDIYTIFLNSKLVAARSNMVKWLGYQQAGPDPLAWDLNIKLASGDRIGIFGRDMAALVV
jgi:hypothetical protein